MNILNKIDSILNVSGIEEDKKEEKKTKIEEKGKKKTRFGKMLIS